MALLEDMFKGNLATGLAIGLGTMVLAPTVMPAIGRVLRPAAKAAIKGGMIVYRETVADIKELTSDVVAEARAELEESARGNGSTHDGSKPRVARASAESISEKSISEKK